MDRLDRAVEILIAGRRGGYAEDIKYSKNNLGQKEIVVPFGDGVYVDRYSDGVIDSVAVTPVVCIGGGYGDELSEVSEGCFRIDETRMDVFSGSELVSVEGKPALITLYQGNALLYHKELAYNFLRLALSEAIRREIPTRLPNGELVIPSFPWVTSVARSEGRLNGLLVQSAQFFNTPGEHTPREKIYEEFSVTHPCD